MLKRRCVQLESLLHKLQIWNHLYCCVPALGKILSCEEIPWTTSCLEAKGRCRGWGKLLNDVVSSESSPQLSETEKAVLLLSVLPIKHTVCFYVLIIMITYWDVAGVTASFLPLKFPSRFLSHRFPTLTRLIWLANLELHLQRKHLTGQLAAGLFQQKPDP